MFGGCSLWYNPGHHSPTRKVDHGSQAPALHPKMSECPVPRSQPASPSLDKTLQPIPCPQCRVSLEEWNGSQRGETGGIWSTKGITRKRYRLISARMTFFGQDRYWLISARMTFFGQHTQGHSAPVNTRIIPGLARQRKSQRARSP
jgi:hypothetical protein